MHHSLLPSPTAASDANRCMSWKQRAASPISRELLSRLWRKKPQTPHRGSTVFRHRRSSAAMLRCDHAPVAQLDRASPSEGEGREFKSRRAHHSVVPPRNSAEVSLCRSPESERGESQVQASKNVSLIEGDVLHACPPHPRSPMHRLPCEGKISPIPVRQSYRLRLYATSPR